MTVVGFYFTSIGAHVDEKNLFGSINITSTPTIESVDKRDLGIGGRDTVGIKFRYVTTYDKAGEISLEGDVLYQVDDGKKTEKLWKDSKRLEDEMAMDVLNFIIKRCIAKTIELSDVLRLPPPIQFPSVVKEAGAKEKKK